MHQPPRQPIPDPSPPVQPSARPTPSPALAQSDPQSIETAGPTGGKPTYAAEDLVRNYGLSAQEAQRLIDRFGPFAAELDFILAGKGRPRRHRRQDIERSAEEIAFG